MTAVSRFMFQLARTLFSRTYKPIFGLLIFSSLILEEMKIIDGMI